MSSPISEMDKPAEVEAKPIDAQANAEEINENPDNDNKMPKSSDKQDITTSENPVTEPDNVPNTLDQSAKDDPTTKNKTVGDTKKDDERLGMYKALAIKLKKELVKCRDELQRLRDESEKEIELLKCKVSELETLLSNERLTNTTRTATLEASVKNLKAELETSLEDLQSLQNEYDSYKARASKIMQQNILEHSTSNKVFDDDRYKHLKELNDDQSKHISKLESHLENLKTKNRELEKQIQGFYQIQEASKEEMRSLKSLGDKYDSLMRENENLKAVIAQFRRKFGDPNVPNRRSCDKRSNDPSRFGSQEALDVDVGKQENDQTVDDMALGSPSVSPKDSSQTNSSSSNNSSSSAFVHIRPAPFEIISRTSVLEEAQNQIDNLTKAYLDSERTNSLLTEQVRSLKDEIRKIQRGTERLHLAENLEYLKNVVFKFLSLDSGQTEQKQRLVPVLSTILKLTPEETAKLSTLAANERSGMASSFFKLAL